MEKDSFFNAVPKNVFFALTIFLILASVGQIFSISSEIKRSRYIGQEFERVHTITVNGTGKVEKIPDIAEVTISVITRNFDLKQAQKENTSKVNSIINFLLSQKIKKEDIKTTSYNIYPQYDYSQYGRKFLGYEIDNSLQVKIRDFENISIVFSKAVELGANEVSGLSFTIDNKEEVLKEARKKAIEDAKQKAKILAEQLGVILVRITNFSESGPIDYPRPMYAAFEKAAGGVGGGVETPQVEPGQNEIVSNVSITYEITTR